MTKVLSVTSGNGGMGKSFFSCNLSFGLMSMGKSVLLAEDAFGVRSDDVILGTELGTRYTIKDIADGICSVSDAVTFSDEGFVPDFICAGHLPDKSGHNDLYKRILSFANERYDFVVFDTGTFSDALISVSDYAAVLTDMSFISVRNSSICVERTKNNKACTPYMVLNSVRLNDDLSDFLEDTIDTVGAKLLGVIPYDEFVPKSVLNGDLIYKYNTYSGKAIENICKRFLGESVPDYVKASRSAIFSKNKLVLK